MPTEPLDLLWLALLGGWVAVDGTSFGQFMISRPFVAAALAGWIVGNPAAGALVGVILEIFHLGVLPVGAARYPEAGPPAVVAGAAFAAGERGPVLLLAVLVFALLWEWFCGETIRYLRHVNVGLVATSGSLPVVSLQRRHLAAVGLDVLRGAVLTTLGWLAIGWLLPVVEDHWMLGNGTARLAVTAVSVGVLASSVRLFGSKAAWFVAGVIGALVLVLARQ